MTDPIGVEAKNSMDKAEALPHGLPRFLERNTEGFTALCELLAIRTTQRKIQIVSTTGSKSHLRRLNANKKRQGLSSKKPVRSVRLRNDLTSLYSDPQFRREVMVVQWGSILEDGAVHETAPPSLELAALRQYDDTLLRTDPDELLLAEFDSFYSPERATEDWQQPALVMLPNVVNDVADWKNVSSDQKRSVLLAVFSVATLLDDVRLLRWAVNRHDEISDEFAFLRAPQPDNVSRSSRLAENEINSDKSEKQLIAELLDCVTELGVATSALSKGPVNAAKIEAVRSQSEILAELLDSPEFRNVGVISDQLAAFETMIREFAETNTWLSGEVDKLIELWQTAYGTVVVSDLATLEKDMERLKAALKAASDEISSLRKSEDDSRLKEREFEASLSDQQSREERRQLNQLQRATQQATEDVLDAEDRAVKALQPQSGDDAGIEFPQRQPPVAEDSDTLDDSHEDEASPEIDRDPADPTVAQRSLSAQIRQASEAGKNDQKTYQEQASELTGEMSDESSDQDSAANTERDATEKTTLTMEQEAIWKALDAGRYGLAYHIALISNEISNELQQPTADLLYALALGRSLASPDDEIGVAFGAFVAGLGTNLELHDPDPSMQDALNLILFAATWRPAVFAAQQGNTVDLLQRIEVSGPLAAVSRLAYEIGEHAQKLQGVRFDVSSLSGFLNEGIAEDRFADLATSVSEWRRGARLASFNFAAASQVWKRWFADGEFLNELGGLLEAVDSRTANVPRVAEIVDALDSRKKRGDLIHQTDRQLRAHRHGRISGKAFDQLENRLAQARELAKRWLSVMGAESQTLGFIADVVESLRKTIERHVPLALASVDQNLAKSPPFALEVALRCARSSIECLRAQFDGKDGSLVDLPAKRADALFDDLLYVSDLPFDANLELAKSVPPTDALNLLIHALDREPDLVDSFEERLAKGDLHVADALCCRLEDAEHEHAKVSRERLGRAESTLRGKLENRLHNLTERLEQVMVAGNISSDARVLLTAEIDTAMRGLDKGSDALAMVRSVIDEIEAEINRAFDDGMSFIKSELTNFLPLADEREQALLDEALEAEDIAILFEQLDCLKDKQPLAARTQKSPDRLADFLAVVDELENAAKSENRHDFQDFIAAARSREDCLSFSFSSLSHDQALRAADLLRTWSDLAGSRESHLRQLAPFFSMLGFTLTGNGIETEREGIAFLNVEPLRARQLCPSYAFGSDANGRYRIVCNFSAPAREAIVQAVSIGDPNSHTIVLHFGKLARSDRDWLRQWSIDHPTQFIVIDECLVLYLATLSSNLLRTMFDCTLPFTNIAPFFTAAGLVPPEAFFGREGERREILDRYGSCFVYGGRQLGKTALLRAAQDAFHDPANNHLAAYVDLKYEDVGVAFGAERIWEVLWGVFERLNVIPPQTKMPKGRDSLVENIGDALMSWLDAHQDGRILVMFDEADSFLRADLDNKPAFHVSTGLKGLMDNTQRAFKVVLCGLHNVLRNTEQANHPLAHLGEPICVGPLLENGDLDQARALVREPLATTGYCFTSDNLITRILLWTNYYPSLIQILGEALLRHLRNAPASAFPGTIDADDLQAVIKREAFRDQIRGHFALTLQLDPRYEVIAYAIAYELHGDADKLQTGLLESEIRASAKDWWTEGFDESEREFRTLLQEMCGLGVLRRRKIDEGDVRYVFRNPNVLLLLGDENDIDVALMKERTKPDVFDGSAFHGVYRCNETQSDRYGPLTYEQESTLNRGGRVALLTGNGATNFADVQRFLDVRDRCPMVLLKRSMNQMELAAQLSAARPEHRTVYLVDSADVWNWNWLEQAKSTLSQIQRGKNLRVVFRADPDRLWDFIEELPFEYLDSLPDWLDLLPLEPWNAAFLNRWISDLNLHAARTKIDELLELTGGWPILLEQYASIPQTNWGESRDAIDRYIVDNRDALLESLGLKRIKTRKEFDPVCDMDSLDIADVESQAIKWNEGRDVVIDPDTLRRRMVWGRYLGLLRETPNGLRLNSVIKRVLQHSST